MPISDRGVTLVKESVVGDFVGVYVVFDLLEAPVGQRVDFDQSLGIALDDADAGAVCTLGPTSSSEHRADVELLVGSLGRLSLIQFSVSMCSGWDG